MRYIAIKNTSVGTQIVGHRTAKGLIGMEVDYIIALGDPAKIKVDDLFILTTCLAKSKYGGSILGIKDLIPHLISNDKLWVLK